MYQKELKILFFVFFLVWESCQKKQVIQKSPSIEAENSTLTERWINILDNRFRKDIYFWNGWEHYEDNFAAAAVGFFQIKDPHGEYLNGDYIVEYAKKDPFKKSKSFSTIISFSEKRALLYADLTKILENQEEGYFDIDFRFLTSEGFYVAEKTIPLLIKKERVFELDVKVVKNASDSSLNFEIRIAEEFDHIIRLPNETYQIQQNFNGIITQRNVVFEDNIAWYDEPDLSNIQTIRSHVWMFDNGKLLISPAVLEFYKADAPKYCIQNYGANFEKELLKEYPFSKAIVQLSGKRIKSMDLSYTGMEILPKEIECFSKLESLNLNNNKLKNIPRSLINLIKLKNITIDNNPFFGTENFLQNIPSQIIMLSVKNSGLKNLFDSFSRFEKLKEINFSENKLSFLPFSFANLSSLLVLNLSGNQFVKLPDFIGNLKKLTNLYVNHNQLTLLPVSLGNLKYLYSLSAHHNLITDVYMTFANLSGLKYLNLSFNLLKTFPNDDFFIDISFSKLDLSNNQLILIPNSIGNSKFLSELYLQNNHLKVLPPWFRNLRLKVLSLENNPFPYCGPIESLGFYSNSSYHFSMAADSKKCLFQKK
jgi:Leucine-rich repeat (LRR) protein